MPQQTYDQVLFAARPDRGRRVRRARAARRPPRRRRGAAHAARRQAGRRRRVPAGRLARRDRRGARGRGTLRRLAADGAPLAHRWASSRRDPRSPPRKQRASRTAPLTIVHAIARLNVGGAALHVLQLAREQAARGHDVVVVAGTLRRGRDVDGVRRDGVRRPAATSSRRCSAHCRCGRTRPRSWSCARSCASAGRTCSTRTRPKPAQRAGSRRCSRAARGRARSSTPTTGTS